MSTFDTFISDSVITEWDMKSANLSVIRYYSLLPERVISNLERKEKDIRNVTIGKMIIKNPELGKAIETGIKEKKQLFLDMNEITPNDIIWSNKDAIFVRNHPECISEFDGIRFVDKNHYSGYMKLKKYDFFYKDCGTIDVKGKKDDELEIHSDGVMSLIREIFRIGNDFVSFNMYMSLYCKLYKSRELPIAHYREFTSDKFLIKYDNESLLLQDIDISELNDINIESNFINIVLEILSARFD